MSLESFSLAGKTALVVGAHTALGRAAAIALAEAGADVVVTTTSLNSRESERLSACAEVIRSLTRKSITHTLDSTNEADVASILQQTVSEFDKLDILVNAPDLPFAKPLAQISLAEWQRVLNENLTSVYLTCRAASPTMLAQQSGRIINIVSVLGERGMANGSAYCAAQAGVLNLTRALSLEWARNGITVNAIGAGWAEGMGMIADEQLKQQLARYVPNKRLAQPHEISDAVVYLASDSTGFITGQTIWLEGGVLSRL
ncbi:MAG: SDR family oxidoreductase [Deltaproteobacteria bacterium]|nr:SDR family oxidoreductase [Deltaproteobacteria bacterium]